MCYTITAYMGCNSALDYATGSFTAMEQRARRVAHETFDGEVTEHRTEHEEIEFRNALDDEEFFLVAAV